jgi:hypothetical protein
MFTKAKQNTHTVEVKNFNSKSFGSGSVNRLNIKIIKQKWEKQEDFLPKSVHIILPVMIHQPDLIKDHDG